MADNKKVQEEELKKLEDEAYFELCQIIAEAMEYQDVDLLNARIASWKNKYKKLLDKPSTNSKSDFKKRIEFLLNQYYSSVTQYILSKLKLHEEKKIEKQAKALRELYVIIRDTNDYDLLKKKVNKWQEKYPISGFLKMYQKRIEYYTRDKILRENAFKQEEAFNDLVDITKIHGTIDELKTELSLWEEKYSINDKYNIDDFIKHQTEVKRYTSDEFLQSIAREEFNPISTHKSAIDVVDQYNNKSCSDLSIQANAYAKLEKISKSPNNINEVFTWVYKHNHIKFNDKYKELILSATYLIYSPTYLKKLDKPVIDISKNSLSYDEYLNIADIKRYAIISYFNLLLPPEKAIANDYFNKHIQTIYAKSEKARVSDIKEETIPLDSGIEISLKDTTEEALLNKATVVKTEPKPNESATRHELIINLPDTDFKTIQTKNNIEESLARKVIEEIMESKTPESSEIIVDLSNTESKLTIELQEPKKEESVKTDTNLEVEKPLDYTTIVALSPLFFDAINNYNKQAVLINHIDNTTSKYVETEKVKEFSLDEPEKTKIDEE